MRTILRIILGVCLSTLSAILIVLSLPPYNLSFLILFSFVPMLISQYKVLPEKVSSLAPAITVGSFLGLYLMGVFAPFNAWYMKLLPLFIGCLTFFTDRGIRRRNESSNFKWFVLSGIFSWVGIEYIRTFIPAFGTWAFLSYAFYNQPWFIQPVKIFSIFGLSLLIMLVNYSIGYLVISRSKKAKKVFILALLVLVLWTSLSVSLYKNANSKTVKVGVIQANPAQFGSIGSSSFRNTLTAHLITLSKEAAQKGAQIILWPEGALNYDPKVENSALFKDFTKETNTYLIIPYIVFGDKGNRNEATILSPEGEFLGVYGKDHPVVFAGETSITRGTYPVFKTGLGAFGIVICYDLDFTDTARKIANSGAQIIFAPSGDWPQIAKKHYTHSIFRAVENGVSVVKAEWAYDSVIIDPFGRIIEKSISTTPIEAVLVAAVPLDGSKTLYSNIGDILGIISLIGMFVIPIINNLENKSKIAKIMNKGRKTSNEETNKN